MTQIRNILDTDAGGYSVFEKDQVLTHDQLNSVAGYLDFQAHLERTRLMGVGIVCGLNASLQDDTVAVTKGGGITTDGDLLCLAGDAVYDRFRIYDEANPGYPPFYTGTGEGDDGQKKMLPVFELVRQGVNDDRAKLLNLFKSETGRTLSAMVALLFMEGYITDRDICSGTDCDNLGQDYLTNCKLLLVDYEIAVQLQDSFPTPHKLFETLNEIVILRPLLAATDSTPNAHAARYFEPCNDLHGKLLSELPKLPALLGEAALYNRPLEKLKKLNADYREMKGDIPHFQYYYDFLCDLAETFNRCRELLCGDNSWCSPDISAFPKHLLLGSLSVTPEQGDIRTPFYPSPIVSYTIDRGDHARFLARKLANLIRTFLVPAAAGAAIRITPSRSVEKPLADRAIPYYYQVKEGDPVHKHWNYRLHQQQQETWNYSYNAQLYGAEGGAATPLAASISCFPFFRIEGHLGQNVLTVTAELEKQINSYNLPFAVHAIMLGADRKLVIRKPIWHGSLHDLHYVIRQDVYHQLGDVIHFSGILKKKMAKGVNQKTVRDSVAGNDAGSVKEVSVQNHDEVITYAMTARTKMKQSFDQLSADGSWKQDLHNAIKAAGEFKSNFSQVTSTVFATPFDSLISSTHIQWLDWLDKIIGRIGDQKLDRQLFTRFMTHHPGIEHGAGVQRGGTFVLLYTPDQTVVADYMLPYYLGEIPEDLLDEPPLQKPGLRPGFILDNGIKVRPSLESSLDDFARVKIDDLVKNNLDDFAKGRLSEVVLGKLEELKWKELEDIKAKLTDLIKEKVNEVRGPDLEDIKGKIDDSIKGKLTDVINSRLHEYTATEVIGIINEKLGALEKVWDDKFNAQEKEYFSGVKESLSVVSSALISRQTTQAAAAGNYSVAEVSQKIVSVKESMRVFNALTRKAAAKPEQYAIVLEDSADEVAHSMVAAAEAIVGKMDTSAGSEGMAAINDLKTSYEALKVTGASSAVLKAVNTLVKDAGNAALTQVMNIVTS